MADNVNLQEEIAKVAYELYEKSGRIEGRDQENWFEAERIVLARYAGKEKPESEKREKFVKTVKKALSRTKRSKAEV